MNHHLVNAIAGLADLPLAKARSLPPDAYRDEGFLKLERDQIFAREWICVGRTDEIPDRGDYLTAEIADQPVIIIRDGESDVRAFANTCRHRNMRLLEGCGNAEPIVCPYHAWSYRLDGALLAAAHWPDVDPATKADCALAPYEVAIWQGWIYVRLSAGATAASDLDGLAKVLAPYELAARKTVFRTHETWATNWKCLAENFMESYHVFRVHPKTIQPVTPTQSVQCHDGGAGFTYHTLTIAPEADDPSRDYSAFDVAVRFQEVLACVFPAHLISVTPDMTIWLSLMPAGPDAVEIDAGIALDERIYPDVSAEDPRVAPIIEHFHVFNSEDRRIVEGLQRAYHAPSARSGPLAPLEQTIWEFTRYLARRLCQA